MFLRFLFSQSQFDHLRYNSLTLALSQKTARKSTRSYSFIAHSLATQEFPVIVDVDSGPVGGATFGECPLYFSALQNSQNVFKVFILTVTIRSPQVQLSDTRTVTKNCS